MGIGFDMAKFKLPQLTTAQRIVLVLDAREIVYDTDLNVLYYGDGSTLGGLSLIGPQGPQGPPGTLTAVVDDTSPQAGGFFDPNGNYIGLDQGVDLPSASPLVIGTDGDYFDITGTTGFAVMTVAANRFFMLQFDAVLIITNSGSIIIPGGANFTTSPGDQLLCFSIAPNTVRVLAVTKSDGSSIVVDISNDPSPQLGAPLDGQDFEVSKVTLKDYGETVNIIGSIGGGAQDIDLELGNIITATVDTAETTFTLSNPSISGIASSFSILLTDGGSQTVNWPISVNWPNGIFPTLSTSGRDILKFITVDGGTIYDAYIASLNSLPGSIGYDLNNLSAVQVTESISSEDSSPTGVIFDDTGSKLFLVGVANASIYQYNLSIAYDLSTKSAVQLTKSVSTEDLGPQGIVWNNDGTKLFMVGKNNTSIYEYDVGTPYVISTLSVVQVTKSVSTEDNSPQGITINNDGTKIYITGSQNSSIYEYNMNTPYDLSTLSVVQVIKSLASEDTDPRGILFNNNGTKIFISGTQNSSLYEYNLTIAYDLTTLSVVQVTKSTVSEDNVSRGIAFNNNGTKIFLAGVQNTSIYEYNL